VKRTVALEARMAEALNRFTCTQPGNTIQGVSVADLKILQKVRIEDLDRSIQGSVVADLSSAESQGAEHFVQNFGNLTR
jgi:hypothetical protein